MKKKSTPVIKMKAQRKIVKYDAVGEAVGKKVLDIKTSSKDISSKPENRPMSLLFGHFA